MKSLENQTIGDLTDVENLKDCAHELERAHTDAALADWTRRWGRAAIRALNDGDQLGELEEARKDADEAENNLTHVTSWARDLLTTLENIPDEITLPDAVIDAMNGLENAL